MGGDDEERRSVMKRLPRTAAGRVIICRITEDWRVVLGEDEGRWSGQVEVFEYGQYKDEPELTEEEKQEIKRNFKDWIIANGPERWNEFAEFVRSEKQQVEEDA